MVRRSCSTADTSTGVTKPSKTSSTLSGLVSKSALPKPRRRAVRVVVAIAFLACAQVPLTERVSNAARRDLGSVVAPVRLIQKGELPISVRGLNRYFDSVEIDSASDGLVVSNRLALERYLLGLNEVPPEWPAEALKAQAIAARTYALWTIARGRTGSAAVYGYDICATVDCQVFSGADVISTESGLRWSQAVSDTRGLAILYDGAPILARYHSTSGGATFDNPEGFPDEPAYPYLQAVPSTTETDSPVYRWRVEFRLDRLTKMLNRSGVWDGGRVTNVATRPDDAGGPYPDVLIEGAKGRMTMPADDFRSAVREEAPALYLELYPSPWHTTSGRLPETLPSERFVIESRKRSIVVLGRGWGHGVGMSQWGAYGLARQGASFAGILTHYYTGVTIDGVSFDRPIEVGVGTSLSSVVATGSFRIKDAEGNTIVRNAVGTWRFRSRGPGVVAVDPPKGYGLPLEIGIVEAPKRVVVGQPAFLTVALSKPANVRAVTVGSRERFPRARVKNAGRRRVTWLAPLDPGDYEVRARADIGPRSSVSKPVLIRVRRPPPVAADIEEQPPGEAPAWRWAALIVGALLAVAVVLAWILGRSRSSGE
jgi:stage II sporulation protein D